MGKRLTTKASATFYLECSGFAYAVRKDVVEIICKVKSGVCLVVNFVRVDAQRGFCREISHILQDVN